MFDICWRESDILPFMAQADSESAFRLEFVSWAFGLSILERLPIIASVFYHEKRTSYASTFCTGVYSPALRANR